jgi:hypothetical protein
LLKREKEVNYPAYFLHALLSNCVAMLFRVKCVWKVVHDLPRITFKPKLRQNAHEGTVSFAPDFKRSGFLNIWEHSKDFKRNLNNFISWKVKISHT